MRRLSVFIFLSALVLAACSGPMNRVVSVTPHDGATDVAVDAQIIATYLGSAEPHLQEGRFTLVDPDGNSVPGVIEINDDERIATFTPSVLLEHDTEYTAIAEADVRTKGKGQAAETYAYSWTFTTIAKQAYIELVTGQAASTVIGTMNEAYGYYPGGFDRYSLNNGLRGNPLVSDGTLYLPDRWNSRVLIFGAIPASDGAGADAALGHADFSQFPQSGSGSDQFNEPASATAANGKLAVADRKNNRVLLWNRMPLEHGAADLAVGQPGFDTSSAACSADRLANPTSVRLVGDKMLVADTGNHRVLVWNRVPEESGTPADLVIGQNSFDSCQANAGNTSPSGSTLAQPTDVWSDGKRLAVVDSANNRVLFWDRFPATGLEPATTVIGQPDVTSGGSRSTSPASLRSPTFVTSNGNQLFVADTGNNRVLVWNALPTTDGTPADVVLGQGDFYCAEGNSASASSGACWYDPWRHVDKQMLSAPAGLHVFDSGLVVADSDNARYLIFSGQ